MLRPVVVPYEGSMHRGRFLQRRDRFVASIKLDDGGEVVRCHCINPGRMEAFVDERAVVWARRVTPEEKRKGKRATDYTWELIERDGVTCSTNTQRPNALVKAVLGARCLCGFEDSTDLAAEKMLPRRGGESEGPRSRCDFFCVDGDGCDHWIEVKNCHSSYPEEPLLAGWGYFPDSVSERAAKHCNELAVLAAMPKTRCAVQGGTRVPRWHFQVLRSSGRIDARVVGRPVRQTCPENSSPER